MKLNKEPVAILGALGALTTALTYIGVLSPKLGTGIGTIIVALGTLFVRQLVMPVSAVGPKVAEAALQTAKRLDAVAAGPPGEVTAVGQREAADVTADVLGTSKDLADQIIQMALKGGAA